MKAICCLFCTAAVGLFLASGGCKPKEDGEFKPYESQGEVTDAHDHSHEHGPHDGHIIELGDHHAELVFDEATRKITVYILDAEAKNAVPIDQREITLNLMADAGPTQLKLKAVPQEGEAEGMSSRFELAGDQLPEEVEAEDDIEGRIAAKIGGEDVSGEISHEGHDHEHEDEEKPE